MGDLDSTKSMSTTNAYWRVRRHEVLGLRLGGRQGFPEVTYQIVHPIARHREALAVARSLLTTLDTRAHHDVARRMGGRAFSEAGYAPVPDVVDEAAPDFGAACLRDALHVLGLGPVESPVASMTDVIRQAIAEPSPEVAAALREGARTDCFHVLHLPQAMFWDTADPPTEFLLAALLDVAADFMERDLALTAEHQADDVLSFTP